MKIVIPIHSFVDLITNSSSETFIGATKQTKKFVKDLTDAILTLSGSNLRFDDLFETDFGYEVAINQKHPEFAKWYARNTGKTTIPIKATTTTAVLSEKDIRKAVKEGWTEDEYTKEFYPEDGELEDAIEDFIDSITRESDGWNTQSLVVLVKDPTNAEAAKIAKMLESAPNAWEIDSTASY